MKIEEEDNSISIRKDGCTFYIKANCIDNDKLVGVNSQDTPGYLKDKVFSCDDKLRITEELIAPGQYKLKFCIDQTKFTFPDEKVKFKSGCDSVYGNELMTEGSCISINKSGCSAVIGIKDCCMKKPLAKRNMTSDKEFQFARQNGTPASGFGWFFFDTDVGERNGQTFIEFATLNDPNTGTPVNGIKVKKKGWYHVWMKGNIWINYAVQAFRIILFTSDNNKEIVVDSKFGAPTGFPLNHQATTDGISDANGRAYYNIGGNDLVLLEADTIIIPGGRVDTHVVNGNGATAANGGIGVQFAGLAGGITLNNYRTDTGAGFAFGVERVSDDTADMRYNKNC